MGIVRTKHDPFKRAAPEALAGIGGGPADTSDIPEAGAEELRTLARKSREKRKRLMFSLRVQKGVIDWWKETLGEGYTTVMASLLEEAALRHPEWIKECLRDGGFEYPATDSSLAAPGCVASP
jgi:uncharacterized protein (DUF4415 family)